MIAQVPLVSEVSLVLEAAEVPRLLLVMAYDVPSKINIQKPMRRSN